MDYEEDACCGCGRRDDDERVYGQWPTARSKIGEIGPLTGAAAIYGTAVANGAQIAIDELNALGGQQYELNAQDDEADAEKSVNAYNNLLDWGAQMMLATVTTNPWHCRRRAGV